MIRALALRVNAMPRTGPSQYNRLPPSTVENNLPRALAALLRPRR
jgi:hypothetical protein